MTVSGLTRISERHSSKVAARNGIKVACADCCNHARFEQKISKREEPYFLLLVTSKQVICTSEIYNSRQSMINGIASVKKSASNAKIEDLTG
jgi:uncharacterized protein YegP (UPF0339 family)